MITWDPAKRKLNLRDHKIDLAEVESVFDGPVVTDEDTRADYGELRLRTFGLWRGRVVLLVWAPREDTAHLISCRYANRQETDRFFESL